jgi:hypothetical protein
MVKKTTTIRDERVAAAEAGRFFPLRNDSTDTRIPGRPQQPRGPPVPKLGLSIKEFCQAVGISVSFYYELADQGMGPKTAAFGVRKIISVAEAERWLRERAEANSPNNEVA